MSRGQSLLRDLMRACGPCGLAARMHTNPFKALARAIVGQQLSAKAAATIFSRFEALYESFPTPAQVLATPDDRLRGVGLSSQKLRYLKDLCKHLEEGQLPLDALHQMGDEAVIETLTRVKGVGRWTAPREAEAPGRPDPILPHQPVSIPGGGVARAYSVARPRRLEST